ncbi:tetratricopeptide repeat protein, partial [Anaerosalibacter bizertensis]|nr:tetratricopeptide repeat protein [Anaerosalibacter bizertensis]
DLPNAQTVFLTRPTISTILMTQMIGRALRGEKAGGTKKAYIVSFVDDWKDKIAWINPETLYEEEGTFAEKPKERKEYIVKLIAIDKIEEFAKMMDDTVDTDELKDMPFIERIPVGLYSFKILIPSDNDEYNEKNCDIMVYNTYRQAYEEFVNDLDIIFKEKNLESKEFLEDYELEYLYGEVKRKYFEGYDTTIGYRSEDIKDILRYFAQTSFKPVFLAFEDREKYDISKIALYIWESDMRRTEEKQYVDELWNDEKGFLKIFFGGNKRYFIEQLNNEIYKISRGISTAPKEGSTVSEEEVDMKKLTLWQIKQKDFKYWKSLTDSVYNNFKDEDGYYFSAQSGFKSKKKGDFQIDHIKPMSKGGLTELSNLQLLTRKENMEKGDKYDESKKEYEEKNNDKELDDIYKKIDSLIEKEKEQEAIDFIEDCIKENESPELYNELGNVYYDNKDYENAMKAYKKAVEIDKDYVHSLYNIALIHYRRWSFDKSIDLLNRVLKINKDYYEALTLLGDIYLKRENFDEALNYYGKSISINNENYSGYEGMGYVYFIQEYYQEALNYYDKAIELNNKNAYAYNMRGKCYKELRMYDKVLDDYYKAIELDPEYVSAYFNLANELDRKRRYKDA